MDNNINFNAGEFLRKCMNDEMTNMQKTLNKWDEEHEIPHSTYHPLTKDEILQKMKERRK